MSGMTMMMKHCGPALAALLLAACGASDDSAGEAEGGGGFTPSLAFTEADSVEGEVLGGEAAVSALPAGFTAYPGADVVSSTAVSAGDGGGGVILVMTTPDDAAQVIEFYQTQALAAGVQLDGQVNAGGNTLIGGEGEGGLAFSASAAPGEDGTVVQLTVGRD